MLLAQARPRDDNHHTSTSISGNLLAIFLHERVLGSSWLNTSLPHLPPDLRDPSHSSHRRWGSPHRRDSGPERRREGGIKVEEREEGGRLRELGREGGREGGNISFW